MSNKRCAVVLCTDRNMIIQALFVAYSVIREAGADAGLFDVVIVTDLQGVDPTHAEWMAGNGILHKVVDFRFLREIFKDAGRLTAATLVKLTLAEIFSGVHDRILYLDADLTIHANVGVLFDLELGGHPLAANPRGNVLPNETKRQEVEAHFAALGMTRPFRYFNSGVLLIDVARWNALDLTCRTLDFITMNRELCPLPDEDSLNAELNGRFTALSPAWNMPPRRWPFLEIHDLVQAAIVHYSGHDKPWKRFGRDKPLFPDMEAYRAYRSFIAASPWQEWLDLQWTIGDVREGLTSALRQTWLRWLGLSRETGAHSGGTYLSRFASYIAEAEFADVSQGFTIRDGPRIRLKC